ncbi:MAG: response regulator transcription factor [Muribaculaceae bacterium]|nr:response regulator transcription factor [Muribaculaceae bacterium]
MKHVTIALLTPSDIIKNGISAILKSIPDIHVNILYWTENDIQNGIPAKKPSLIIADSLLLNGDSITSIRNIAPETRIITMSTGLLPQAIAKNYDAIISIYDNTESISNTIKQCLITDENGTKELTPREKDVVIGIVKGLSNKEMALKMNVSVNTVMTHRRNIASKLQIHSAAGLTIYAIVSKLVRIEDVKQV